MVGRRHRRHRRVNHHDHREVENRRSHEIRSSEMVVMEVVGHDEEEARFQVVHSQEEAHRGDGMCRREVHEMGGPVVRAQEDHRVQKHVGNDGVPYGE